MKTDLAKFEHAKASLHAAVHAYGVFYSIQYQRPDDPLVLWAKEELRSFVPRGIYEHWKSVDAREGSKFYAVDGVSIGVDHSVYVTYSALYGLEAGKSTQRKLIDYREGFLAPIDRPDGPPFSYIGPRFALVRSLSPMQSAMFVQSAVKLANITERDLFIYEARRLLGLQPTDRF